MNSIKYEIINEVSSKSRRSNIIGLKNKTNSLKNLSKKIMENPTYNISCNFKMSHSTLT